MKKILIFGATGNVGKAVCHLISKFDYKIVLSSRKEVELKLLCSSLKEKYNNKYEYKVIDASNILDLECNILQEYDLVINAGLPYFNINILEECIKKNVNYIDSACFEPENNPNAGEFNNLIEKSKNSAAIKSNITAILQMGASPGLTNVFTKYINKYYIHNIKYINIFDSSSMEKDFSKIGKKYKFSTNFNVIANILEFSGTSKYYDKKLGNKIGLVEEEVFTHSTLFNEKTISNKPIIFYRVGHEEAIDLFNYFNADRVTNWMDFTKEQVEFYKVIKKIGLNRTDNITINNQDIKPIQILEKLLPTNVEVKNSIVSGNTTITVLVNSVGQEVSLSGTVSHMESIKNLDSHGIGANTAIGLVSVSQCILENKYKSGVFTPEELPNPEEIIKNAQYLGMEIKLKVDNKNETI